MTGLPDCTAAGVAGRLAEGSTRSTTEISKDALVGSVHGAHLLDHQNGLVRERARVPASPPVGLARPGDSRQRLMPVLPSSSLVFRGARRPPQRVLQAVVEAVRARVERLLVKRGLGADRD